MSYLALLQNSRPENNPLHGLDERRQQRRNDLSEHQVAALRILNRVGCRIIRTRNSLVIGLWQDLDCPEVRAALDAVNMSGLPIVHLETASVPVQYKVRICPDRLRAESFSSWLKRAEQISQVTK